MMILLIVIFGLILFVSYSYGFSVKRENAHIEFVSHTEYWREDFATTIVRVSDYRGSSLDVDGCGVTILYPNKTIYVNNQSMSKSNIDGNWYRYDDLSNQPLGTYEQEVSCYYDDGVLISSQSFHLNPALEAINVLNQDLAQINLTLSNVTVELFGVNHTQTIILEKVREIDGLVSLIESKTENLTGFNISVTTHIDQTGEEVIVTLTDEIESELEDTKTSIVERLNQTLNDQFYPKIKSEQATALLNLENNLKIVLNSSIVNLSMIQNQTDNLEKLILTLQNGCTSRICTLVENVSLVVNEIKNQAYLYNQDVNNSLNTINLALGDLTSRIDSITESIASLVVRTDEINQTTHKILDRIEGEIQIRVIS